LNELGVENGDGAAFAKRSLADCCCESNPLYELGATVDAGGGFTNGFACLDEERGAVSFVP
jgi:hypothetical protein